LPPTVGLPPPLVSLSPVWPLRGDEDVRDSPDGGGGSSSSSSSSSDAGVQAGTPLWAGVGDWPFEGDRSEKCRLQRACLELVACEAGLLKRLDYNLARACAPDFLNTFAALILAPPPPPPAPPGTRQPALSPLPQPQPWQQQLPVPFAPEAVSAQTRGQPVTAATTTTTTTTAVLDDEDVPASLSRPLSLPAAPVSLAHFLVEGLLVAGFLADHQGARVGQSSAQPSEGFLGAFRNLVPLPASVAAAGALAYALHVTGDADAVAAASRRDQRHRGEKEPNEAKRSSGSGNARNEDSGRTQGDHFGPRQILSQALCAASTVASARGGESGSAAHLAAAMFHNVSFAALPPQTRLVEASGWSQQVRLGVELAHTAHVALLAEFGGLGASSHRAPAVVRRRYSSHRAHYAATSFIPPRVLSPHW